MENVEFRFASGPDPCHFLRQSDEGNFAEFPVSVYGDFPAGTLLPSSGAFSCRIRRESAGKNTVCGGIRLDPMIGIIDLGNACLSSLIFTFILSKRDALWASVCVGLLFKPQGREGYLIFDDSSDCQEVMANLKFPPVFKTQPHNQDTLSFREVTSCRKFQLDP